MILVRDLTLFKIIYLFVHLFIYLFIFYLYSSGKDIKMETIQKDEVCWAAGACRAGEHKKIFPWFRTTVTV